VAEKVTVLVTPAFQDRFDEVVERTRAAGLQVESELRNVGVIAGSIESNQLDGLRSVEGVAAVEIQRVIQLPPPDSEIH
jgi:hypothetical protein